LSARIRAKIKAYADKVAADKMAVIRAAETSVGHAQSSPPATDRRTPKVASPPSRDPTEWPEVEPPAPKVMTYKQVRALCPEASASWIRELIKSGITDEDELAALYDELLEAKPDPANPTQPMSSSLWDVLFAIGMLSGIPIAIVVLWQRRKASSTNGSASNANGSISPGIGESLMSSTPDGCVPFSRPPGT
jgi:hypothetical protein